MCKYNSGTESRACGVASLYTDMNWQTAVLVRTSTRSQHKHPRHERLLLYGTVLQLIASELVWSASGAGRQVEVKRILGSS